MGIYTRDNINYGGMLGNAMANRANYLQHRYDAVRQMGQNWGNAVANSGKAVQDAFNKYADYSNQRDTLAAQQQFQREEAVKRAEEQLARQREQEAWQARQNDLSRQNTMDIALLNKQNQDASKIDEWTKYYNVANAKLVEIDAMLRKNPNDETLKFQRAQAMAELNLYGSKLGIVNRPEIPQGIPAQTGAVPPTDPSNFNNADLTKNIDTILNGKWTNANKATALNYVAQIQDPALKAEYEQKIANKLETIEETNARLAKELADAQAQFAATGTYDSKKFRVKVTNGKASLVRK